MLDRAAMRRLEAVYLDTPPVEYLSLCPTKATMITKRDSLLALSLMAAASALLCPHSAHAGDDANCPAAGTPYSSKSALLDLLLAPKAKAVLERDHVLGAIPPFLQGTTPPTFSAIVTPETVIHYFNLSISVDALDHDLSAVPVSVESDRLRCARYDTADPGLAKPTHHPAILVFEKSTGFRDGPSVAAAKAALKEIATKRGWYVAFTDSSGAFTDRTLRWFDAVVWNNVSGDVLTMSQRRAFQAYMERGGGYAGIHGSGGDPVYFWDWYADILLGARFAGHPQDPQFQNARLVVERPASDLTRDLEPGWNMTEEWYSFKNNPRSSGAHVQLSLDESSYSPVSGDHDYHMGDHPIAWTRCLGNGRSFYSAIGHRPEVYSDARNALFLERGIAWAAGLGRTDCSHGKEHPRRGTLPVDQSPLRN